MRLLLTAGLTLLASVVAAQETVPFGPGLQQTGWRTLTFRALKPVDYRPASAAQLDIIADQAASVIWRELPEQVWSMRGAAWRWRVQAGPPATDLSRKGEDDRAIAIYFVFARDEAAARWAKGASSLTSAMWWSSGAALVYVYGGSGARGQVVQSPHLGDSGKLVIRQPGGAYTGAWLSETADLSADFRRAFGREPGPLVGVAISSDSDDTGVRTSASIDNLQIR